MYILMSASLPRGSQEWDLKTAPEPYKTVGTVSSISFFIVSSLGLKGYALQEASNDSEFHPTRYTNLAK